MRPPLSPAEWEEVAGLLKGMRRTFIDDRANKGKDALLVDDLKKLLASIPKADDAKPVYVRNRALFTFLFYSAMRRSEVAALVWSYIDWRPNGIIVRIRKSKGDQEGQGQLVDIHTKPPAEVEKCTVFALKAWQTLLAPTSPAQPVFPHILRGSAILREESVGDARILKAVKQQCGAAGLPAEKFGAHSFRSGFITSGAQLGIHADVLQRHARHRDPPTTFRYIKRSEMRWPRTVPQLGPEERKGRDTLTTTPSLTAGAMSNDYPLFT